MTGTEDGMRREREARRENYPLDPTPAEKVKSKRRNLIRLKRLTVLKARLQDRRRRVVWKGRLWERRREGGDKEGGTKKDEGGQGKAKKDEGEGGGGVRRRG